MLPTNKLIQIELVARYLMALILMTAGISKFFSDGGFSAYYLEQFTNEALRINIPGFLVSLYLGLIPYIEVGLGMALLFASLKPYTVYVWYVFMASLLVGHYILEEWSSVNQMLVYFLIGMVCHALPTKNEG